MSQEKSSQKEKVILIILNWQPKAPLRVNSTLMKEPTFLFLAFCPLKD